MIVLPEVLDRTNASNFEKALESLWRQGCSTIKIDCVHLEMIDSSNLGTLILFQKKLRAVGEGLQLIQVNHRYIKHLFEVLQLNRFLTIDYLS